MKIESEVAQSCSTLSDLMDCSLPGSSAHGIFQARVLEWGANCLLRSKDTIESSIDNTRIGRKYLLVINLIKDSYAEYINVFQFNTNKLKVNPIKK